MPTRKPLSGDGKRSPRRRLADCLARLRAESGLTLRELADKVGWDHGHLSKLEQGKTLGGPEIIEALDTVYGTTPLLMELWELARDRSVIRDKYQRFMELSATAEIIRMYSPALIPGLLQTEAYARRILSEGIANDVEEQLSARLERQSILMGDNPVHFRAIIDEAALRRPLEKPHEWREQLAHLVQMAQRRNITTQILPLAAGLHSLPNTHTVLVWQPDGTCAAYVETGYSGELFEHPEELSPLRLAYDRLRDLAWSPRESVAFIEKLMEDIPCDPLEAT